MPHPNRAHPRCLRPDCCNGRIFDGNGSDRECDVCSHLWRRDEMESLGAGPPTRRSLAVRLAAHFDQSGLHGWAARVLERAVPGYKEITQ